MFVQRWVEKKVRRHLMKARKRPGFGWKRWSREWIYTTLGLFNGYRVSWQTTLGGSPPGVVYPNMKKWSGDHGSYDYKSTPGTLISTRPLPDGAEPSIMDIAPTVLKYFGLPIPSEIDGKPLF